MHWEVTLMTDNKKVPRLRFKEFTDAWEQRKLGEISNIIAGGDKNINKIKKYGKYPVIANSINKNGIVGYYDNEYRVKAPAVTVTGRGEIGHAVARFQNFTPIVRLLALSSKLDPIFLANSINKIRFFNESTGVPQLTKPQLSTYSIIIPSVEEQNNIGKLILLVEKYIHLHQRKLNLLNQLKKGMLQKLFAGKNQKQPNLRFKGFADTWKKETLKEVSQWSKGQGLPRKDLNAYEKGKEVIHYADLYKLGPVIKGVIHWSTSKEGRKIPTNSIIFPMSDVTPTGLARTSAVVKDGILAGGDVLIDNLSSKIQSKFLSYEINANSHQILSLVTGTTVKHINSKSLNRLSITYPNMQEQEMISNTLENIFTQIEFYRYRISKLQQLKKSLLQNMFI